MTDYDCTFPPTLPSAWYPVWDYTFERSGGPRMRETIMEILERKKIHHYRPGDVLSGDLIAMWTWRKAHVIHVIICEMTDTIVVD